MTARGRAAEELIAWTCQRLEADGRAWLGFTSPPTIGRPGALRYRAGGLPDVVGCIAGGRAMVFDVKSTSAATWSWGGGAARACTKAHQIRDLQTAGRLGALAGLLVLFLPPGPEWRQEAFWVPWEIVDLVATISWTPEALRRAGAAACPWPRGGDPDFVNAALASAVREDDITHEHQVGRPRLGARRQPAGTHAAAGPGGSCPR